MLPRHTRCLLRYHGHSFLLNSCHTGIGRIKSFCAVPVVIRPTNLSPHLALSCYQHFAARSLATPLSTNSGLSLGDFPGFWGYMVSYHAPIPCKGSINNNINADPANKQCQLSKTLHYQKSAVRTIEPC